MDNNQQINSENNTCWQQWLESVCVTADYFGDESGVFGLPDSFMQKNQLMHLLMEEYADLRENAGIQFPDGILLAGKRMNGTYLAAGAAIRTLCNNIGASAENSLVIWISSDDFDIDSKDTLQQLNALFDFACAPSSLGLKSIEFVTIVFDGIDCCKPMVQTAIIRSLMRISETECPLFMAFIAEDEHAVAGRLNGMLHTVRFTAPCDEWRRKCIDDSLGGFAQNKSNPADELVERTGGFTANEFNDFIKLCSLEGLTLGSEKNEIFFIAASVRETEKPQPPISVSMAGQLPAFQPTTIPVPNDNGIKMTPPEVPDRLKSFKTKYKENLLKQLQDNQLPPDIGE